MKRRTFVGDLIAAGAFGTLAPGAMALRVAASPAAEPQVRRVLVAFKCHLDVGFVDTEANVIRKYFEEYFPRAIQTAAELRRSGTDRYVWTTGSWLVYEYLEQATTAERKKMEEELKKMNAFLEQKVEQKTKELQERVKELERFYKATIDRELRMKEMRTRIEELEKTNE